VTLVFAASDKGGTGRSVTSTNVAYRHSLLGRDVCYVDFDFGSPTSGAIFNIGKASRGTMSSQGGLHAYFAGQTTDPVRIDAGGTGALASWSAVGGRAASIVYDVPGGACCPRLSSWPVTGS